jgi:hypothetical protein
MSENEDNFTDTNAEKSGTKVDTSEGGSHESIEEV